MKQTRTGADVEEQARSVELQAKVMELQAKLVVSSLPKDVPSTHWARKRVRA